MNVSFREKFLKDLSKIKDQRIARNIENAIESVELAQSIQAISNLKKLKETKIAYRIKVGDYRIGVFFDNNVVEFARVLHRKDIYRSFP
jgi:mRNA interferase RelE/StbE